jgi:hypothetical protein
MEQDWSQDLANLMDREVVLDTAGTLIYLGTVSRISANGVWLKDADVRDQRDGHASKELYIIEAARQGIRVNRANVFVARPTVMSVSALSDVVT